MKHILILFTLFLLACGEDCSECQEQLKRCAMMEPIPLELPKPQEVIYGPEENTLTVEVTAEDRYIFQGSEYDYEELVPALEEQIHSEEQKLKIFGDKMAHYDAVFQLITFSKERDINPILAFQDE